MLPDPIDRIIEGIIEREGGYVNHPDDRGGPTNWGITQRVARAAGYHGPMPELPRATAKRIYVEQYFQRPGFERVARLSLAIAAELTDSGVNFGPGTPSLWLQRWLNALNLRRRAYEDLNVDGKVGQRTLTALSGFLALRGRQGEQALVTALNCSQGARYLELAEGREANEEFLYGWLVQRVLKEAHT